jgi:hypothetical protein
MKTSFFFNWLLEAIKLQKNKTEIDEILFCFG